MLKIKYVENKNGLYFTELQKAFENNESIEILKNLEKCEVLVLGPGFLCDEWLQKNKDLPLHKLDKTKCLFLNKEYKNLNQKIEFINKNNIQIVFTAHHSFKEWNSRCPNATFYKIPFAYNQDIFTDYQEKKIYDLGFTGNLFNKGPYIGDEIMGKNFNNVRERIFDKIKTEPFYSNLQMLLGEDVYLKGKQYGKTINSSKIWICTPSAIDLVGTRFYEIMGCNTLLLAKVIENENIYDGLFEEGKHFIGFKDDLSDFTEKVKYYLSNEVERVKITKSAYELVNTKHCWKHRVDKIVQILKEHDNE
jgi:hypothetical protein